MFFLCFAGFYIVFLHLVLLSHAVVFRVFLPPAPLGLMWLSFPWLCSEDAGSWCQTSLLSHGSVQRYRLPSGSAGAAAHRLKKKLYY